MTAALFVPASRDLGALRAASLACRGCPLWKTGTQTVFGEGPATARVVMVGEQPGDREDREGRPFVGPAGKLLDDALVHAGIDRRIVYVTNAVKHFKWEPAGKRRLHKKPSAREVAACRPWLAAEFESLRPDVVIALGATAAQGIVGPEFRVTRDRGKVLRGVTPQGEAGSRAIPYFLATVHPSSILRGDPAERETALAAFIADLKIAAKLLR
jgi:DNA polymerase